MDQVTEDAVDVVCPSKTGFGTCAHCLLLVARSFFSCYVRVEACVLRAATCAFFLGSECCCGHQPGRQVVDGIVGDCTIDNSYLLECELSTAVLSVSCGEDRVQFYLVQNQVFYDIGLSANIVLIAFFCWLY